MQTLSSLRVVLNKGSSNWSFDRLYCTVYHIRVQYKETVLYVCLHVIVFFPTCVYYLNDCDIICPWMGVWWTVHNHAIRSWNVYNLVTKTKSARILNLNIFREWLILFPSDLLGYEECFFHIFLRCAWWFSLSSSYIVLMCSCCMVWVCEASVGGIG